MTVHNPYSCTEPGNLFVGYQPERTKIVERLEEGSSFALIGGRRCGKTSLLKQLHDDLLLREGTERRLIPILLDMHGVVPRTPHDFFGALEQAISGDLPVGPWEPAPLKSAYASFLLRMRDLEGPLAKRFGPRWAFVFLIDELDAAARSLPTEEVFQNLRSLLSFEACRAKFRVVCAGVNGLEHLVRGGSPLNILEKAYTRALTHAEAEQLGRPALDHGLTQSTVHHALRMAGGHAFIIQALLSYLWAVPSRAAAPRLVESARAQFVIDRREILDGWLADLGPESRAAYEALLAADREGRATLPLDSLGLNALRFHALIDVTRDPPRISCELFRRWYCSLAPSAGRPLRKRVFIVSGRDSDSHHALRDFLQATGLEPLEWKTVIPKTGVGTPDAFEVLNKGFELAHAVVVLLTPDDQVSLDPDNSRPGDPPFEGERTGQPRPNVLIEAGMALQMFPKRTILIQVGEIRPMSDLAGLQFLKMDGSLAARQELRDRLKAVGCDVDESSTAWHTAGGF